MDKDSLAHSKWNCKYHIVLPIVFSITQAHTITHKVKSLFICGVHLKVMQTAPLQAAI